MLNYLLITCGIASWLCIVLSNAQNCGSLEGFQIRIPINLRFEEDYPVSAPPIYGPEITIDEFHAASLIIKGERPDPFANAEAPPLREDLFQGDIRLQNRDEYVKLLYGNDGLDAYRCQINSAPRNRRGAPVSDQNLLWSDETIPYLIDSKFGSIMSDERVAIARGILDIETQTCIKFKFRTDQSSFISIEDGDGCNSHVGVQQMPQIVNLDKSGCFSHGIIIHELSHAAGFWHEQSRPDRDEWIEIVLSNVEPGREHNFNKYAASEINTFGVEYDYGSVMHYGPFAFSTMSNVLETIRPKKTTNLQLGQRVGFTSKDVRKLNFLYSCPGTLPTPTPTPTQPPTQPTPPPTRPTPPPTRPTPPPTRPTRPPTRPTRPPTRPTRPPTRPPTPDSCVDQNYKCHGWSKHGECYKNPTWMKRNCKKSCNQCDSCVDQDYKCAGWAKYGECYKNPTWMKINCRKSCNQCGNNNSYQSYGPPKTAKCEPRVGNCPQSDGRFGGGPQKCASNSQCPNDDICCFDKCLVDHVCKPGK